MSENPWYIHFENGWPALTTCGPKSLMRREAKKTGKDFLPGGRRFFSPPAGRFPCQWGYFSVTMVLYLRARAGGAPVPEFTKMKSDAYVHFLCSFIEKRERKIPEETKCVDYRFVVDDFANPCYAIGN
ncbi:MAG: hypothetical protein Q4B70_14360 [Lachnospiraceae bacterium]|nr:hypothetical protein [Lachnospiraceae bacterium]